MLKTEFPSPPEIDQSIALGQQKDGYFLEMAIWYRTITDFILDAVDSPDEQQKVTATVAYKQFRCIVDEHSGYGNLLRSRREMTEFARNYFLVLTEASTRLRVKRNARPNREMLSSLYSFMVDINFYYPRARSSET